MRKILFIAPHFPPSNLAAVHRTRLFARHLPAFGWEPQVLTVHERYYEETPDWELMKLVPASLRVYKVKAFPLTRPRLIGDLGLRAFFQLYKAARKIIKTEQIEFLYIPIPSFYPALLGRWLHARTGVKYGIDYIDPWVHVFPGSEKVFSRHWFSTRLARFLEPIAVRKAALITGVASGYYEGVLERNPYLADQTVRGAMPYGGEEEDHRFVRSGNCRSYLFEKKSDKLQLVYAGALLPKAYGLLQLLFETIRLNPELFRDVEFHFIGTGKPDASGMTVIENMARSGSVWQSVVFEHPRRIPYLDVLVHIHEAAGAFILGSTEPHYTPSKTYQAVLSRKPIWAILHKESSAASVMQETNSGLVYTFGQLTEPSAMRGEMADSFRQYRNFFASYDPRQVDMTLFESYSAREVTGRLAEMLNQIVPQ
jgi:hypothetical protein